MNNAASHGLNREIVRKHTAMGSAEELRTAIHGGYVPTVHRKRQAALLAALKAEGLPAFEIG